MTEIEWWYAKGYRRYSIWDDNFTMIRERVVELCDLIEQSGMTGGIAGAIAAADAAGS